MTAIIENTTMISVRNIPLDKLIQSDANVRKAFRGGIAELAASIEAHGLLQNLTVRPERDLDDRETGRFEVLAGGRRLMALKSLVKRKKIARNQPIPCNVRKDGVAEELSLAENFARSDLHPADQFEAFRELHITKGMGAEEIAARFGIAARTVKERLKLASISPKLLKAYREGELTLDQVMAFAVSDNHARQEEVWDLLTWNKEPSFIRECLLSTHVSANDKRARFIGIETYEAAGGVIFRDLFADDHGGYLVDPVLLEKLVLEKLDTIAEPVRAEGWKWVDLSVDFPHGHGMRRIYPRDVPLPDADAARLAQLETELEELEAQMEASEETDPALATRYNACLAEYETLDRKGRVFDADHIARSGAIIALGPDGEVEIVRGLIHEEDHLADEDMEIAEPLQPGSSEKEKSGLSEKLLADLTAHKTMALRDRTGSNPETATLLLTHALALQLFYLGEGQRSCLDLFVRSNALERFASDLHGSKAAKAVTGRHEMWAARLPEDAAALWDFVVRLERQERFELLAHCTGLLIDAVCMDQNAALARAGQLADAVNLDMRDYWTVSVASYLGRVPKSLILEAAKEGVSEAASKRIADLKKADMAEAAENLLKNSGWLPAVLRRSSDPEQAASQAAE